MLPMNLSRFLRAPALFLTALFLIHIAAARAEEPVRPTLEVRANVQQVLARLKPNQAVVLGEASVVGEFNAVARRFGLDSTGPRARNYSIKMVWVPERRRALFTGANHGTPHRLNDVWEFDLLALSWVLLYAPDNPRSYSGLGSDYSDVEFHDGVLVTKRGGPAVIAHTWWGLTWDPKIRRLLFMNTWVTKEEEAIRLVGGNPAERYTGPPLWAFDPQAGKWEFVETRRPWPAAPFGAMLEYVPELGGSIWHMNNWKMRGTWLYRASERSWSNLRVNRETEDFKAAAPGAELVGYYDPSRRIVVAQRQKETYHFDVARAEWKKVAAAAKDDESMPYGHDARNPFHYDPVSRQGLLVDVRGGAVWSYDPDQVKWTRLQPQGDSMPRGERSLVYVDHAANVLVVIDDTKVWAYRYRLPAAQK